MLGGGRLKAKEKFKEEKDCHTPQVSHTLMYSDLFTYKTRMHYKYVCSSSITIQCFFQFYIFDVIHTLAACVFRQ